MNTIAQKYAEYLADKSLFDHSENGLGENLYQTCVYGSMPDAKSTEIIISRKNKILLFFLS